MLAEGSGYPLAAEELRFGRMPKIPFWITHLVLSSKQFLLRERFLGLFLKIRSLHFQSELKPKCFNLPKPSSPKETVSGQAKTVFGPASKFSSTKNCAAVISMNGLPQHHCLGSSCAAVMNTHIFVCHLHLLWPVYEVSNLAVREQSRNNVRSLEQLITSR